VATSVGQADSATMAATPASVTAGTVLEARGLTVARRGKIILNDVSFAAQPQSLVAIIGPNGAGKSTLMRALVGERPNRGQVLLNGQDVYLAPELYLRQIGYVPVDNILHDHLTVEEALTYVGHLRLPGQSKARVAARVDELLSVFGFPADDERRRKLIRVLSSGELKRANVCAELVIDPELLLLDEPTSNLDPNAEYELMSLLAAYAHRQQKTVLIITHTLNMLELCDQVLFIENSELRAQGRPDEVLAQLAARFDLASAQPGPVPTTFYLWAQIFDHTRTRPADRRDYVREARPASRAATTVGNQPRPVGTWWHQFGWLFRRYMRLRLNDRLGLVATLLAGFSGVLFFVLPGNAFMRPYEPSERTFGLNQARQAVYVIALVVTVLGMITTYTEISREYRIYAHERLKGLSPSAYFLSKWTWLTGAVGVLAPLVLVICIVLIYQQPLPGFPQARIGEDPGWWDQLLRYQLVGLITRPASWLVLMTLVVSCITSVTVGLLISAAAGNSGRGHLYLAFAVVFVILFSCLIRNVRLEGLIDSLSFFSTGKWAYEGLASSLSLYCWTGSWRFDEFNSTGHLLSIGLSLVLFALAAGALAVAWLHVRDPWHAPLTNLRLLATRNAAMAVVGLSIAVMLFSNAMFMRQASRQYHNLTYWSRADYGGNSAFQYADVRTLAGLTPAESGLGLTSQSWCSNP